MDDFTGAINKALQLASDYPSVSLDELRADLHRLRRLHEQEGI